MGGGMDSRVVEGLAGAARRNVVEAYVGLVRQLPGARVEPRHGFLLALSDADVSFSNFAAGFERTDDVHRTIQDLVLAARWRRPFWAFLGSDDGPPELPPAIEAAGFVPKQTHFQMAAEGPPMDPGVELEECRTPSERREAASFMCEQFFWQAPPRTKRTVEQAVAGSPHTILVHRDRRRTLAAAMVTHHAESDGLYNLCVLDGWRGRGMGSGLVATVRQRAAERGVPVLLHCEDHLTAWYRSRGFKSFGRLRAFSWLDK